MGLGCSKDMLRGTGRLGSAADRISGAIGGAGVGTRSRKELPRQSE